MKTAYPATLQQDSNDVAACLLQRYHTFIDYGEGQTDQVSASKKVSSNGAFFIDKPTNATC